MTDLAGVLRRHGVPFWFSDTNIQGAQKWHDEIGTLLKSCDWMVLVLSPHAVASKWVRRELVFSLQDDRFDGRIVPVVHQQRDHAE